MTDWNTNPGVDPDASRVKDISVAVMYTGSRADKMITPLKTTDLDLAIEPDNPWDYDVMLLDNADRNMVWPVFRKHWPDTDTKVVYRMRGNVYEEIGRWDMNPQKEFLAKWVLRNADGFVCVNEGMATIARRRAGVTPTGVAGLSKELADWPTVTHTDGQLRAISLTNADYFEKAEPLVRFAHVAEEFFESHGGEWNIYGKGLHDSWLRYATDQFDHVHFQGYTNAVKTAIKEHNVMFHFSDLDALPNSVLEGLASNLPVVTNPFHAFTESPAPLQIVHDRQHFISTMHRLQLADTRQAIGDKGRSYIASKHSPEYVGQEYVRYILQLLNHDA